MFDTAQPVIVSTCPDDFVSTSHVPDQRDLADYDPFPPLSRSHLILAVSDCLLDHTRNNGYPALHDVQERLWREDPGRVAEAYDNLIGGSIARPEPDGPGHHGLRAERLRALRAPLPTRERMGLTLRDIADRAGIDRATLAVLMEERGYLEMVPYGGKQRRRLVTQAAFDAELGHNVDPSIVRLRIEGANKTSPFPVFYEEALGDILWTLDYEGLVTRVRSLPTKKSRLEYLLVNYPGLTGSEMSALTGYSRRTVEAAKAKADFLGSVPGHFRSGSLHGSSGISSMLL